MKRNILVNIWQDKESLVITSSYWFIHNSYDLCFELVSLF
uniref:Uncharacterized protein n=1 Tax=Arundo donax TaxID=35708 RepID=A0A0A8Y5Q7_ARUDO